MDTNTSSIIFLSLLRSVTHETFPASQSALLFAKYWQHFMSARLSGHWWQRQRQSSSVSWSSSEYSFSISSFYIKRRKKLLLRTVLSIYCHLINNVKIFMGSNWVISKMNITKKLIFLNLYSLIYTHTDHQREYHLLVKTPEHPHSKYYYHWYGCHPFYVINVWYLNLKISGYKNKFSWTFQMSCQLYQLNQISKG